MPAQHGEHDLAIAALDASTEASRAGELLFSESLGVKERALLGRAAASDSSGGGSASPHWPEHAGKERLLEVMGRMRGEKHLLERFLRASWD